MFEFIQYIAVFARVKRRLLLGVEVLDSHVEMLEVEAGCCNLIDVDSQSRHQRLVALGEFAHGAIVDWVSVVHIAVVENLAVFLNNIARILLEHVRDSDDEVFETIDKVSVLIEGLVKDAVLNVHILQARVVLLVQELIEKRLL